MDKKISENTRVAIRNVMAFPLYMSAQTYSGDICIPALARNWRGMTAEEAHMQVLRGNPVFVGTDGTGTNARVVFEDEAARAYAFDLEQEDGEPMPEQVVFDRERAQALFAVTPRAAFVEAMKDAVRTASDRKMLAQYAREVAGELRKYQVDAISEYTGAAIK